MIYVTCTSKHVCIYPQDMAPGLFSTTLALLKQHRCTFNSRHKVWQCSVFRYDEMKEHLEDLDSVIEESTSALQQLREGESELECVPQRIIADYSLMKHQPIQGKSPHENFQREAIVHGLQQNRYAFFLGQGSGKSYIASVLIAHYYLKWKNVSKIVLLSTPIGVRNVYEELFHFIKGLDATRVTIATKDNDDVFTDQYDIVIASYATFRLLCTRAKKKAKLSSKLPEKILLPLEQWKRDGELMLLLDESHLVANSRSQQGHYVTVHSAAFKYRYLFSGTPADKPEKLYNQFKILDPVLVHRASYTEWLSIYAELGTKFSAWAIREWKHDKFEELNKRVRQRYATFLTSEELLDLPPHYMKRIYLDMTPQHRKLYELFVEGELDELKRHNKQSVRGVVNRFPYMLLAVDNPFLLEKHRDKLSSEIRQILSVLKVQHLERLSATEEVVDSHEGEKGVLWVEHPHTAYTYAKHFAHCDPIVITGDTKDDERKLLVDTFQRDSKHQLLIANIHVLNTSVTITSATYQVYVERGFAYVPYEQSIKRIYRIGQKQSVTTYVLLYKNSLDILRDRNLASKGALVGGLLSKAFLTQKQWQEIFNGASESL